MISNEEVLDLLVLYGSETTNSEELAKRVGRQAIDRSIRVRVLECDEYDVSKLIDEELVVFICSTTGVGEEPNNMKKFWKFIRRKQLPKDSLSSVYISVIGLGDSSYQKYNFVAKKLYKRLIGLGGMAFKPLVLGDDQSECGPYGEIDPWLKDFWSQVINVFSITENPLFTENSDQLFSSSFNVRFIEPNDRQNDIICEKSLENRFDFEFNKQNPYLAEVLSNERITSSDHFQDVRLIKLKTEDKKLIHNLGDICCIKPQNSSQNVSKFLSLLNLDRNKCFIIEKNENNLMSRSSYYNTLPNPCSVETLVTEYMDIQSIPKRSFFDLFYRFSESDLEKEKLKDFANNNSSDDLHEYCTRPKRNILEVMTDFPNTTPFIPFQYLFDLIPALNPRSFSIASSMNAFPNELHLLVAVVQYSTRLKEPRLGLCSNWLSKQLPQNKIPIFIRKGTFSLAPESTPIITIGPGTGVAPFRAFIEDRVYNGVSNNFLFFGCRYQKSDFYFENEWKALKGKGFLQYFVAFSRDSENKVYVQHKLWDQKELVFDLITNKNAVIYVAGNAKQMPQQIKDTICDVIKDQNDRHLDIESVKQIVENMEIRQRIQYECWS